MSVPTPIPCAHCGTNFMRRDLDPDAPKLCNTCIIKDQQRNPKGETNMSKVNFLVECDRATQIEIEEICTNQGLSISAYFMNLHALNIQEGWTVKSGLTPEIKEFHDEFESKAIEGKLQNESVKVPQRKSRGGKK